MTDLMDDVDSRISDTDGDIVAHIIRKKDWERGYIEGKEVEALCGVRWIPSRDPEDKVRCQECLIRVIQLRNGK